MRRHPLVHLEMHITHACNLGCKYCSHYCDFGYAGEVSYVQGEEWLRAWAERLAPENFRLLGGEPLLHKDAAKYVRLCAELFSEAKRDLVTNGLLLRKREDLLAVLMETGTRLSFTLHPLVSGKQEDVVNDALDLAYQYKKKGLRLHVSKRTDKWMKGYRGEGVAILPFTDGAPERSFQSCGSAICKTLHQGKLWKCPPLAYLPLIAEQLETKESWEPYLRYEPLGIDASDEAVAAFIKGDSRFCDMCPAQPQIVSVEGIIPHKSRGARYLKKNLKKAVAFFAE
ncbi:MAG: radical SAM protein [Desulfovibrionaceae bacterium]|nr:radical SAM protein [Desulfovibrionaceae bacterium]